MERLFDELAARLERRPGRTLELPGLELRESSVLVPLYVREGELRILLTRRPTTLRAHAGQISFPGGRREPEDLTPLHAALREAEEEVGIPREAVRVLGMLDELPTPTRFRIAPFVGLVSPEVSFRASEEVAELIDAPLLALTDRSRLRVEKRVMFGKERDLYFFEYERHVVWGATAHILNELLRHLEALPSFQQIGRR